MWVVYYVSVTTVGTWATDWANDGVFGEGWSLFGLEVPGIPVVVEGFLAAVGCADWLSSLSIRWYCGWRGRCAWLCAPDAGAVYFPCVS